MRLVRDQTQKKDTNHGPWSAYKTEDKVDGGYVIISSIHPAWHAKQLHNLACKNKIIYFLFFWFERSLAVMPTGSFHLLPVMRGDTRNTCIGRRLWSGWMICGGGRARMDDIWRSHPSIVGCKAVGQSPRERERETKGGWEEPREGKWEERESSGIYTKAYY